MYSIHSGSKTYVVPVVLIANTSILPQPHTICNIYVANSTSILIHSRRIFLQKKNQNPYVLFSIFLYIFSPSELSHIHITFIQIIPEGSYSILLNGGNNNTNTLFSLYTLVYNLIHWSVYLYFVLKIIESWRNRVHQYE